MCVCVCAERFSASLPPPGFWPPPHGVGGGGSRVGSVCVCVGGIVCAWGGAGLRRLGAGEALAAAAWGDGRPAAFCLSRGLGVTPASTRRGILFFGFFPWCLNCLSVPRLGGLNVSAG